MRIFLHTGSSYTKNPAIIKQIVVMNVFSTIGCLITFCIGVSTFFQDNHIHTSVLFITSFLFLIAFLIQKAELFRNPYPYSSNLMLVTLFIVMAYLIQTGGVDNTGPLWVYIIPPIALFFGGIQKGLINLGLFGLVIATLLFYPDDFLLSTHYSNTFKLRFIYSLLTVTALFTVYEFIREKSYTELEVLSQQFEFQAKRDMLSGLHNRRGMMESLEYEYKRSKRTQSNITLIMCDLDKFKSINDQFGHEKGDEVIKTVSRLFQLNLRELDTIARWGGEEFLILLPMTDKEKGIIIAEKLRDIIQRHVFTYNDKTFNTTVSMGLYQINTTDSINDAISAADNNLYKAKALGRNQCIS
ncbi:GGDEF domain-containing protein [Marinicellulosiphila megalodicopiae]|uniref:GGDEF domain-containing protein n=1 Tax=Marinicellulosiphila megalodicopiae TaxID=2724896 RepID=UPI003BAE50A4